MNTFKKFLRDESGVTAIEYGLIAGLIAVVIITVIQAIGTNLNEKFTTINNALQGTNNGIDSSSGSAGV